MNVCRSKNRKAPVTIIGLPTSNLPFSILNSMAYVTLYYYLLLKVFCFTL